MLPSSTFLIHFLMHPSGSKFGETKIAKHEVATSTKDAFTHGSSHTICNFS
jgi:hypothetical protein